MLNEVIRLVQQANKRRNHQNFARRHIKLSEEYGEVSEAYLSVTSPSNAKGKTWDDVREELADCLIVTLDLILTPLPDQENYSPEQIEQGMMEMVRTKLAKWETNQSNAITDGA